MSADPIQLGLVPSLGRPGGNVTGVTSLNVEVAPKRLELLCEVMPTATTNYALVLNTKDHKTGQHPLKNRPGGKRPPKPEKRGSGATSAEITMHQAYSSAFSHDQDPERSQAGSKCSGPLPWCAILSAVGRQTGFQATHAVVVGR